MEFNIKRNDFVRPKDVRRDVVQKVCDYIVDRIEDYDMDIRITGNHPHISYAERKSGFDNMCMSKCRFIYSDSENSHCYNLTPIRTCEMKLVFKLLQDAGYYIYKADMKYIISVRPYLYNRKAERIDFDFFID